MRRLLPIVLMLMLLASCGPSSFVAQRYDNFTAYYNTFYNAQRAFDQGVEALESSEAPIDRERYLPVFVPPGRAASTQDFGRAIQKSADVLREHPNSKWVDDALVLIGKSYFYRQNYVGAAQKFREVIALESPLEGEARFWLARALIAAGDQQAAADHLRESLYEGESYGRWTDMMHLVQGELHVRQGAWEEAVAALNRGLAGNPDEAAAARAAFLLGQVQETMGAYSASARAFEYVNEEFNPYYELSYAAHISAIRVRGQYGETETALQQLRRLEYDDKHYEKRDELALLRGQLYHVQERSEAARWTLHALLYEDESPSSGVRGRAHYALGKLYQHAYDDFHRAAAHFDTAATALGQRAQLDDNALGTTPTAVTDHQTRADLFNRLSERAEAVSRMDSLLYLGSLDDEAFQQFVATLNQRRVQEQTRRQRSEARRQAEQRFVGERPRVQQREQGNSPSATTTDSEGPNFLFHQDPVRAQEARRSFERRWGRRPLVPNWRRMNAIAGQGRRQSGGTRLMTAEEAATLGNEEGAGAAAVMVDVSDVPRDSASQAQMRAQRATARYELANALFLAAQRPDSAAAWYERVIDEDADQPVARRALYALAEVHRAQGDTTAAQWLYQQIIKEHPGSQFARRAQQRLDDTVLLVEPDSIARAKEAYEQAYETWQRGDEAEALPQLVDVAVRYPATRAAPKALWAAATLFMQQHAEERLRPDMLLPAPFDRVLAPAADSAAVLRASRAVAINISEVRRPTLRDLLVRITEQYPESPHARRAERFLGAMETMVASADSTAAGSSPADTAAADSTASGVVAADSLDAYPAASDTAAADTAAADTAAADTAAADTAADGRFAARPDTVQADTTAQERTTIPEADLRADDAEDGAWSIVVAIRPRPSEAESVQRDFETRFRNEGLPVGVVETVIDDEPWYYVAVGTFADEQTAAEARQQYGERLPDDVQVLRVR